MNNIHNVVLPSWLSISRNSSSHQTENFFQLKENSSFPTLPAPGNLHSTFCLWESDSWSTSSTWTDCSICPFASGLFHLAQCLQVSSMPWHVSQFPRFWRLNNIPLYVFTILLFVHSSTDEHLGCCHLLAIVNIVATVDWMFLWFQNSYAEISSPG